VNLDSTIEFDYGEKTSRKFTNLSDIDDTLIDESDLPVHPVGDFSDMPPLIHIDDINNYMSSMYLRRSPINTSKMFC
jgi:hypothetical protein